MEYIITYRNLQIIDTNITSSAIIEDVLNCNSDCERVFCKNKQQHRRQGLFGTEKRLFFLCSYDQDITNRIFKTYFKTFIILAEQFDKSCSNQQNKESQKNRRLKHNLITHSSNILQELYKLVPQDSFRNGGNHVDTIEEIIRKEIRKSAFAYLKILKNANLMKAEFDVYEMLETENPYLDFSHHSIHKVLILTINPFWLDLAEQNVTIFIDQYHGKANIDYRSISVVLSHIFDNLTKYIMPYSTLYVTFLEQTDTVTVVIVMNSLKVESNELERLFEENYSGCYARKLNLDGDGIGMFVVKKLTELNKGKVIFEINIDKKGSTIFNDVPYEKNRISLILNK
jgi:light-regulated signal transduction histidine kinase (bacteriophytochrome)